MKNKSDLKRKVLCSLLAASTMGIFYSSDALAATIGAEDVGSVITNDAIFGMDNKSGKLVIGHGDVNIQAGADIPTILNRFQEATEDGKSTIDALRYALSPVKGEQTPIVGVVGGEVKISEETKRKFTEVGFLVPNELKDIYNMVVDKINAAQAAEQNNYNAGTTVTIGSDTVDPVVIGSINGDLVITAMSIDEIHRVGDITENVNGGNVIGSFGGSAALAIAGKSTATVEGNIYKTINGNSNIGLYANGGLALDALGGQAVSIVDGNTSIKINTSTNGEKIDAMTIGVAGGGAAVAIDQNSKSESTVTGTTNIEVGGNGTAIGLIGGGIAAGANGIIFGEFENNDVVANASTGKANIVVNLEAKDKKDKENAATNIGKALSSIISTVKAATDDNQETEPTLNTEELKKAVGQGAAVGVFGGGVAAGIGGNINGGTFNVNATATTDGANISLENGYVAGVFGGGAAIAVNNAKATATNGDVTTHIEEGMKAVGVFGGGFALSAENGAKEDNSDPKLNDTLASSTVKSSNIVVDGQNYAEGEKAINSVDGIYGGGMAIGNSILSAGQPGKDAATHVGTTNITVNSGTINNLELISIMDASKNDNNTNNDEGWQKSPWWNSLGMNASMAMVDLKGITDETSISAGGMAMGMSGSDTVDKAYITINGGEVKKDILGGGIAVDNSVSGSGAHVGESIITLNGGKVEGSIYAGGAINGTTPEAIGEKEVDGHKGFNTDSTSSTVGEATVILNGTEVTGEISGHGYELKTNYKDGDFNPFDENGDYDNKISYDKADYDSVGTSTLEITGNNTLKPLETSEDDNYISDDSKIHSFNNINVAAGSVTTLEGLTATENAALIDATGTKVDVKDGAKLDISALEMGTDRTGKTYKVVSTADSASAEDKADDKFWTDSSLVYDRTVGYATGEGSADGNYNVTYKDLASLNETEKTEAVNDFVGSLGENGSNLEGIVGGLVRDGANTNAGAKEFFADASSTGDNSGLAAMAMIGEAAGVTSNTIDVAGDMADNSVLRLSFTQDDITGEPKVNEDGAIWAKYIHNKHDLDGMASSFGSVDSSSDFDGATIGVDFAKKGKVQSGIAFSYGSGDSHGMGINNDFDMWGVSLYGNVKNDDTNVIADIGFSESDNELTGTAMGKDIKADRDVSVFTVGVRAEKLYTNGSTQIVPYTGLRYYNVDPDSYTAYYDGQKFGEYDADRQNIWTLPVGVSLRNETVTESGWRLTPKVDVAYIWAFGDTDNSFDLNTGSGVDTLDYTVMDSGSWLGSVGFEAGKDDWAFGVGYSYQKGSHEEANKWFVNVEYSF